MATPPRRALLYGGLLLHTVLSAGSYLCGKTALREIPPLPLGLLRFLGASALLVLLLLRVRPPGQRMPPKSAWPQLLVLSFVVVPVSQGFFQTGLALSTAAHAALLYSLTPLFVMLLAQALRRELPGVRTALGTLIALAGTLYVLAWRGLDLSRGPLFGDLLLLVAVIAWALFTAEGRPLVSVHGPLPVIAWTLIAGTAMYLPLGIASLAAPGAVPRIVHASRRLARRRLPDPRHQRDRVPALVLGAGAPAGGPRGGLHQPAAAGDGGTRPFLPGRARHTAVRRRRPGGDLRSGPRAAARSAHGRRGPPGAGLTVTP